MHIGQLIQKEIKRQERTIAWFSRKLCCDYSTAYKLFKRKSINTDDLIRISKILNHNFFDDFRQEFEK